MAELVTKSVKTVAQAAPTSSKKEEESLEDLVKLLFKTDEGESARVDY